MLSPNFCGRHETVRTDHNLRNTSCLYHERNLELHTITMTPPVTYLGKQTEQIRELVEQERINIMNAAAAATKPTERPIAFIDIPKCDQMMEYAKSL